MNSRLEQLGKKLEELQKGKQLVLGNSSMQEKTIEEAKLSLKGIEKELIEIGKEKLFEGISGKLETLIKQTLDIKNSDKVKKDIQVKMSKDFKEILTILKNGKLSDNFKKLNDFFSMETYKSFKKRNDDVPGALWGKKSSGRTGEVIEQLGTLIAEASPALEILRNLFSKQNKQEADLEIAISFKNSFDMQRQKLELEAEKVQAEIRTIQHDQAIIDLRNSITGNLRVFSEKAKKYVEREHIVERSEVVSIIDTASNPIKKAIQQNRLF